MRRAAVSADLVHWRWLGRCAYEPVQAAQQAFTARRAAATADEFWCLEHEPVFTLGQAGRAEHVLLARDTPVVRSDRGGQVTWHGPGQLVVYLLVDLRRRGLGVRALVTAIETAIVDYLAGRGIAAAARPDAPGVYVDGAKIASLGLRIRRGCSYHGLALNVDAELAPFACIDPCGMRGLAVTRLADLGVADDILMVRDALLPILAGRIGAAGVTAAVDPLPDSGV